MIDLLAWVLATPFLLLLAYLLVELTAGLARLAPRDPDTPPAHMVLLIPAHDESASIAETVRGLAAASPTAHILVVADNCSDNTAERARAAGAEAIERNDRERRGKGFALAFGRDHLAGAPPDAVIVVDADCRMDAGSAERLAAAALISGAPVQASNLLASPPGVSPLVSISNFAMLVKNVVRARGLLRIGGGALLFGTGMAFPWSLFARLPLASANAVEDLELGLRLAREGIKVGFDDGARVTSPAASLASSRGQRSRWEHGFLDTARRQAGPLLGAARRRRSRHLAALGAHLLVPPLALLLLAAALDLALVTGLALSGADSRPAMLLLVLLALVALALLAAWWREARALLPARDLLRAPLYLLWKLPVYLAFFTRRQTGWNRTGRD
ncbi:glycosyltransferase family 2 protein [Sphingopyxis terrae]|uniref:glycosyltransferase family 2 protein n=1 Tax=Sphingopyxis terrae TaxID=33052 RepID=UPI001C2C5ED3|nr:glycosyltransferase family 2 protein [Sphingopyxis terrae]QXF12320.1 glycosyltransferase [Sphingopyxis terrae subsp. terrae]